MSISAFPDVRVGRERRIFFFFFHFVDFFSMRRFGPTSCGDLSRDVALTVLQLQLQLHRSGVITCCMFGHAHVITYCTV